MKNVSNSRGFRLIVTLLISLLIATPVFAANKPVNASKVAGTYQIVVPRLNYVYYGVTSPTMTSPLKIAKNGSITGTWVTSTDGLTASGSTKVKGQVTKVTKAKYSTKASFTFTLSNGAKGKGTAEAFNGAPGAVIGSLKAGSETVQIAGVRQ